MSSPESTLHIRRDLLDRSVREYADNLEEQVYAIWRKLGVKDSQEFERLIRERKISEAVAIEVSNLLRAFRAAVEKNEAPIDERTYEVSLTPYLVDIGEPVPIGKGLFAFSANIEPEKTVIVDHRGRRLGMEYDSARFPVEVDGSLFYAARLDEKGFVVQGKKVVSPDFERISNLYNINGKLAIDAFQDGVNLLYYNGKEIFSGTNWFGPPGFVGGKLVCWTMTDRDDYWQLRDEDGNTVGDEVYAENVGTPIEINGQLAFSRASMGKWTVSFDSMLYGFHSPQEGGSDEVGRPCDVNGKLAFRARVGDDDFIIVAEKNSQFKMGPFSRVGDPVGLGEHVLFPAVIDNEWRVLDEHREPISPESFDMIYFLTPLDDRHVAIIGRQGQKYIRTVIEV